jgi:hypothetical protein
MAIKTFTTGEVLTASDTNTYLANSGLVYIKEVALTGTAVNITSCFSATYDAYQIVISNLTNSSGGVFINWQLLSGTTPAAGANYNSTRISVSGATVGASYTGAATSGNFMPFDAGKNAQSITITQPFLALWTTAFGQCNYGAGAAASQPESFGSVHTVNTSYDGIRLISGAFNFSTGKAVVYGYRQS